MRNMTHTTPNIYQMPDDVPENMRQPIAFLRQWLNEDRKATPMVTNEEIWHWLKSGGATLAEPTPEVEEIAQRIALNMDGRTVTSHEHYRQMLTEEITRELTTFTAKHEADIEKAVEAERLKHCCCVIESSEIVESCKLHADNIEKARQEAVEAERVTLLLTAEKVLKEMNKVYAVDIKHANKKQWLEPEEFERIFLHRFNNAGIQALTHHRGLIR